MKRDNNGDTEIPKWEGFPSPDELKRLGELPESVHDKVEAKMRRQNEDEMKSVRSKYKRDFALMFLGFAYCVAISFGAVWLAETMPWASAALAIAGILAVGAAVFVIERRRLNDEKKGGAKGAMIDDKTKSRRDR